MHLKKGVIGLQVINCNKWTTEDEKVYILNKSSYSNWKTI